MRLDLVITEGHIWLGWVLEVPVGAACTLILHFEAQKGDITAAGNL